MWPAPTVTVDQAAAAREKPMASVESSEAVVLMVPIKLNDFRGAAYTAEATQSYLWRGQAQVLVAASYFHSLFLSALHLSSYSRMSS